MCVCVCLCVCVRGLRLTDSNGEPRCDKMNTYLCFVDRDAGSQPTSLIMGHGEKRFGCMCVRVCACVCACVCMSV